MGKKTYASERLSQRAGLFNASNFGLGRTVSRRCPRVYLSGVIAVVTATLEHFELTSHKVPKSSFLPSSCLLISSHLLSSLQPLTVVEIAPFWHSSRPFGLLLPKLLASSPPLASRSCAHQINFRKLRRENSQVRLTADCSLSTFFLTTALSPFKCRYLNSLEIRKCKEVSTRAFQVRQLCQERNLEPIWKSQRPNPHHPRRKPKPPLTFSPPPLRNHS